MPEDGLVALNQNGSLIQVNRFQIFARLSQYYAVESVSRALDYRLQWHRMNQSYIFGEAPKNVNEPSNTSGQEEAGQHADREVHNNSNPTFLAGQFTQLCCSTFVT